MLALFIGNAVLLDQGYELPLVVALEGRFAKVWVARQEIAWLDHLIGEVAASATGHQDLFADLVGALQHQYPSPTLGRGKGAEQPGGAGTKHYNVEVCGGVSHGGHLSLAGRFAADSNIVVGIPAATNQFVAASILRVFA